MVITEKGQHNHHCWVNKATQGSLDIQQETRKLWHHGPCITDLSCWTPPHIILYWPHTILSAATATCKILISTTNVHFHFRNGEIRNINFGNSEIRNVNFGTNRLEGLEWPFSVTVGLEWPPLQPPYTLDVG